MIGRKMEHILKLQPRYFDYMQNGTKRIELRLFDEKRQKIKIGDTIKFLKEPDLIDSFNANCETTAATTIEALGKHEEINFRLNRRNYRKYRYFHLRRLRERRNNG